jgi:hypothetical protein
VGSQNEIVDVLVARALELHGKEGHVLSFGFRSAGGGGFETKHGGGKVECLFPNWMVSFLKTPVWQKLLALVGEEAMMRVLWDFPILVAKQHNVFMQLTGLPLASHFASPSPPPSPPKIRLNAFVNPHARVSKEQARKFVLSCLLPPTKSQSRKRLPRSWIRALPLIQQLLEAHKKCPYGSLLKHALSDSSLPSSTQELLLSLDSEKETPLKHVKVFLASALSRLVPTKLWGEGGGEGEAK